MTEFYIVAEGYARRENNKVYATANTVLDLYVKDLNKLIESRKKILEIAELYNSWTWKTIFIKKS